MAGEIGSKAITIFAVFVFIISIFSVGVFYLSARTLFSTISGYATSVGEANLTVESTVIINFTTSQINWGSGRVNSGQPSAGLNTFATNNVTNGNWTLQNPGGLRIENLGNVNVTLNLTGTKTAAQMIGGTGPSYKWNVTSFEAGACTNATGGSGALPLISFYDVNTSSTLFCNRFQFLDDRDVIRIDFNLTIPSDSLTGALGDTITAIAFASS
ncbi:MAG: hypothetical protein ACP5N7_02080 [Candidatus Pacearchaeota archaeon]